MFITPSLLMEAGVPPPRPIGHNWREGGLSGCQAVTLLDTASLCHTAAFKQLVEIDLLKSKGNRAFGDLRCGDKDSISHSTLVFLPRRGYFGYILSISPLRYSKS